MSIYNSLKFIRDDPNINFEEQGFTFSIVTNAGEEIDLLPNGAETPVTNDNKH